MDRICPNCNTTIDSSVLECPTCGFNFRAAQIIADKTKDSSTVITGSLGFPCPFCKKEISEYHENCPFCHSDLTMGSIVTTRFNWRDRETSRKGLIVCPHCKYPAPTGIPFCTHCKKPFPFENAEGEGKPEEFFTEPAETSVGEESKEVPHHGNWMQPSSASKNRKQKPITVKMSQIVDVEPAAANREQLFFPPGCISAGSFKFEPELESGLRSISPEKAPMAILSSTDGELVYHLIAGTSFYLGRQADVCHIPSILFPEQAHRERNSNVSRLHSQIIVRGERVYLKDLSKNGTFLFKEQIAYNQTVTLSHGDEIWVSDVLGLQVSIFTDGRNILGILLDRLENQTGEHYILAPGPVPMGNNQALPIVLEGSNKLHGAIYYNTRGQSWCLRYPISGDHTRPDRVLDVVDEFVFGSRKFSFYVL